MTFQNVGGIDRALRLLVGVVLLAVGAVMIANAISYAWIVAIVGALLFLTGAIGFCALYVPFKLNTRRKTTAG